MPDDAEHKLLGGMALLRRNYVAHLEERKGELLGFAAIGESRRYEDDERSAIKDMAHKLAGTGATYGMPAVSEAGRTLELLVRRAPSTAELELGCEDDALLDAIQALIAAIDGAEDTAFRLSNALPALAAASNFGKHTEAPLVLVVDDDPYIREVMMSALQESARVIMAKNSEQALRKIADEQPDFLLLDDSMPGGMSGLQLLEHLRAMPDDPLLGTTIIMVTASAAADSVRRAATAGVTDYIAKPFSIEIIREKILKRIERRRKTVLVVDDDEAIRAILGDALETAGFSTTFAEDGHIALQRLRTERPDLVLLDRAIPGCDGIAILQEIRRSPRLSKTPVIMVTANRDAASIHLARKAGASDYCVKPFKPQSVVERCVRLTR